MIWAVAMREVPRRIVHPLLYDTTLTDTADDGEYRQIFVQWVANLTVASLIHRAVPGVEFVPGFSFPNVTVNQGAIIQAATFTFALNSAINLGSVEINGETPAASPTRWSTPHPPLGASAIASTSFTPAFGIHSLDVTAIVQAIVNHANWAAGDMLNLWASTLVPFNDEYFINVGFGGQSPRLTIYGV